MDGRSLPAPMVSYEVHPEFGRSILQLLNSCNS
jgi:hypothetical protein